MATLPPPGGFVGASALPYEPLSQLPIPQFVFNGAAFNTTPSEVSAILQFGQRPLAMLILSPSMAKSFANGILDQIRAFETATGTEVLTVEELNARVEKHKAGS